MDATERRLEAMSALIGCKIGERDKNIRKQHRSIERSRKRPVSSIKTHKKESNKFSYKSCESKKAYDSQGDATRQLHFDEAKHGVKGRVYYCEHCHRYHLTFHKPRH